MTFVTDENDVETISSVTNGFQVYLSYQRTGGIDSLQFSSFRNLSDFRGNTVSAEQQNRSRWDFIDGVYKRNTLLSKPIYHVFVVDDFMPHIDRRAVNLQRLFDDVDRATGEVGGVLFDFDFGDALHGIDRGLGAGHAQRHQTEPHDECDTAAREGGV